MGKILKETFAILNKNLWLLFLFMTISYIGVIYFSIIRAAAHTPVELIIAGVTLLFIAVAGVAGFFNTLRSTLDLEYNVVKREDFSGFELIKTFPRGVSEYFLPALGIILLYLVITFLMFNAAILFGSKLIGMFSFSPEDLTKAFSSMETLAEFQKNISPEDMAKLSKWHLLYMLITSIMTYLLIYWLPETFYNTKNSALALFRGIKKVIMHPLTTLQLFAVIILINVLTSVLMAVLLPIPVLMFLVYFIYFYGLVFILMLIFNFYREKFVIREFIAEVVEEEPENEEE
ncbi:MAG: hypothetical protein NC390_00670 [Fusobacterium sp.]|nr:hypothetical protein [Fusobacterium sp.]